MYPLGLNSSHYVLFLLLLFASSVTSSRHFRIIDDTLGDFAVPGAPLPIYSPSGVWTSQPGNCPGCKLNPNNTERMMNGTWHDTTHLANAESRSIELTFTGIAISVFCILPPKSAEAIVDYDLDFRLDGRSIGKFTRKRSEMTDDYQYNVSVISLEGLENRKHTFIMEMAQSPNESVALFDYATYIHDDEGIITEKKKSNLGAIIGGVLGSLAVSAGAALLFIHSRRRRADVFTAQAAQVYEPFLTSDYTGDQRPITHWLGSHKRGPTGIRPPLHDGVGMVENQQSSTSVPSYSFNPPTTISQLHSDMKLPPPAYSDWTPSPMGSSVPSSRVESR